MKKIVFFIFLFILIPLYAQHSEQVIKGVFLSKFVQYVYWPENHFLKKGYISIVFFTETKLSPILISDYKHLKIKGYTVKITKTTRMQDLSGADVIFIAKNQKNKCEQICKTFANNPILIVSEFDGAAQKGSHINIFITQNSTLSFEINPKAFKRSNLSPDAGILVMGKIIE